MKYFCYDYQVIKLVEFLYYDKERRRPFVMFELISEATNELGLTPLFDVLKELSLPPVPAAITKKTSDYIEQIARVKKVLGKDVFFRFDIIPDPRNTSNNIMFFDTLILDNPLPK